MSAPLHRQLAEIIATHRYRATLESDLADVIAEWSHRASYQQLVAALEGAIAALDEEEPALPFEGKAA